ncbi:extensin family protein [Pseudohoeflea sp. DP4N28-3]|uniref:Extensin family protein n=2 Tax=Pseudohoeflea coraliihabitans TaxID=2860393 RepID=A0ABS6WPY0_9HYPH|nr:extensin family protein [Pseudohoeflea sp. DP4N28-3]
MPMPRPVSGRIIPPKETIVERVRDAAPPAGQANCLRALTSLGVVFEAADPVREANGCGISQPLTISGFADGVQLDPPAMIGCKTAVALAQWIEDEVKPAAARRASGQVDLASGAVINAAASTTADANEPLAEGRSLAALVNASGYVCRSRNNGAAVKKMSEHSYGRAIDISAFTFADGTRLPVTPRSDEHTLDMAFQRAVRGGACLYFTTVLGPGSDAYHSDHLHLDRAPRRGGYRICQ